MDPASPEHSAMDMQEPEHSAMVMHKLEHSAMDMHELEHSAMDMHKLEHSAMHHCGSGHYMKDYGNIPGHVDPGILGVVYGLIWTYNILKRFQIARREAILSGRSTSKLNFRASLFSLYYDGCCCGAPVEAFVLVGLTVVAFIGEFAAGFRDGKFIVLTNTHHMCMFFFFSLTGVTNILLHYRVALPRNSDFAMFTIACIVEGLLFSGHVDGRANMNSQVHMFLVYTIIASGVFTVMEVIYPRSVLASLGRALSITLHGQWFCAVAFILYPPSFLPKWDQEDHGQMAIVTTLFVVTIAGVLIGAFITNIIVIRRVRRMSLPTISRIQNVYYGQSSSSTPSDNPEKPLISDSDCEC